MTDDKQADFFKWEFTLAARSPAIWAVSAHFNLRAADLLFERAIAALEVRNRHFSVNDDGVPETSGRRLDPDEIELLGDVELHRPALLLLGFAIENLAKSILILRDSTLIGDDGTFVGLKSHKLHDLLAKCRIVLSDEQNDCLRSLTDYLVWFGRYPIPLSYDAKTSTPGAWVPQRTKSPQMIWGECRPLADLLIAERDR